MRASTLIVGGGVAGLATAWFLARRGARDVVLLERERTLGTQSSGRSAAILRSAIPEPTTRALAREGARFLAEPPEGFSPVPLLDRCGLLLVADEGPDGPLEPEALERWDALCREGPLARRVDSDEVGRLAPHYGRRTGGGLWIADEGRIDVAALIDGFARGARAAGAALETDTAVARLVVEENAVRGVELAGGERLEADVVVLAAGGWAGRLGAAAGSRVRLRPTRRHLLVTAPDPAVDPRWPVVWTLNDEFYARPESGGLMLCACDQVDVDPDAPLVDDELRAVIAAKTAAHLPDFAAAGAAHFWAGVRTLTADQRFAVGPDADLERLFWVAGLGGHGMVAGAAAGRLAADLLAGRDDPLAQALHPRRLRA